MQIAFARLLGGDATYEDAVSLTYMDEQVRDRILGRKNSDDEQYAQLLLDGIEQHREEIDDIINDYLKDWSTDTISNVELTILRIAVFELKYTPDVPKGAVIDEAVELAKKYCDDDKHIYINAVLGAVARDIELRY